MAKLTIRDIARMAGVSTTAVSFVLNNRPGVSEATRQKVMDIIHSTGFTPNVHTRRLNLGKSNTIHVVLRRHGNGLDNQFVLETLNGIFSESKQLGYSLLFTFVDGNMDCEQILDSVRSKDCDGVILNQVADPGLIASLQQEHIPFVCVDAHMPQDGTLPLVEVDYYDAAYQATAYLQRCGHTKIGFIGPDSPADYYMSTFGGYTAALKDAQLLCDPAWLFELSSSRQSLDAGMDKLLESGNLPTAFLCAGDAFAIDAIRCAKAKGLRVPEDLSIIGLDDLLVSQYLDPPLTTVTFQKDLLGQKAMHLLHQILEEEACEKINLIKTTLVERSTVKKI